MSGPVDTGYTASVLPVIIVTRGHQKTGLTGGVVSSVSLEPRMRYAIFFGHMTEIRPIFENAGCET